MHPCFFCQKPAQQTPNLCYFTCQDCTILIPDQSLNFLRHKFQVYAKETFLEISLFFYNYLIRICPDHDTSYIYEISYIQSNNQWVSHHNFITQVPKIDFYPNSIENQIKHYIALS